MKMTFEGEELALVIDALRAVVPTEDQLGDKIFARYYKARVEELDDEENNKRRIGFIQ